MTLKDDVTRMQTAQADADRIAAVFREITNVGEILRAGVDAAVLVEQYGTQATELRAEVARLTADVFARRGEHDTAVRDYKQAAIDAKTQADEQITLARKNAREKCGKATAQADETQAKVSLLTLEVANLTEQRDRLAAEVAQLTDQVQRLKQAVSDAAAIVIGA